MSPKLFSVFVDELIESVEMAGFGVKIGIMRISCIMYADDLLIFGEIKVYVQKLLEIIDRYGIEHGMKFNPDKTELIVFNRDEKEIDQQEYTIFGKMI